MRSLNRASLIGNAGKKPEMRSMPSGMAVATFTLATTDRRKDAQGNWQDKTEWHDLRAFGRVAEIVRDYVDKGSRLYIEGKIETQSWDDAKSGQKKYRTVIIVNELVLLDKPQALNPQRGDEIPDEDIPF